MNWVVSGSGANPATAADFIEGKLPSGTANFAPGQAFTTLQVDLHSDFTPESEFLFGLIGKASVTTKATPGFTANVGTGVGFFGNFGVVVEYASAAKTTNARIYVDATANGNLDSSDMLIQATGVMRNGINSSNFVF